MTPVKGGGYISQKMNSQDWVRPSPNAGPVGCFQYAVVPTESGLWKDNW